MRLLLIAIPFLFSTSSFSQTVIIAHKTKDAIYVGADSREVDILTRLKPIHGDTSFSNFCKIKKIGKFYVAVFHEFADESFQFASIASAQSILFKDFAYIYAKTFAKYLAGRLDTMRSNHLQY